MSQIPRRNYLNKLVPAEFALHHAIEEVEKLGADPRLTAAVLLIQQAHDLVSNCIDAIGGPIALPNPNAVTTPPEEPPPLPGQLP